MRERRLIVKEAEAKLVRHMWDRVQAAMADRTSAARGGCGQRSQTRGGMLTDGEEGQ